MHFFDDLTLIYTVPSVSLAVSVVTSINVVVVESFGTYRINACVQIYITPIIVSFCSKPSSTSILRIHDKY